MKSSGEIKRITLRSLINEAWHTLTHVEQGLWRTIIDLAVAPGKMLHNFLEGDRKPYQKPLSFLLIATGIFALVMLAFHKYYLVASPSSAEDKLYNTVFIMEAKYYSWLQLLLLPLYGLVVYVIFKKLDYNYGEWLVVCCYVISFSLLLIIPFYILDSFLHLNRAAHHFIQLGILLVYTLFALNSFLKYKMNRLRYILILLSVIINYYIFVFSFRGAAYLMTK